MTTRGRWSVLALALTVAGLTACSNGCASANGGLYVGVRAAKTVVQTLQHGEEKLVCGRPDAPPAPACVTLELHHTIHAYIEEAAEYGQQVSLIMADMDGLKQVNDILGHAEGDKLIRRAAEVLQASVRAEDLVTRTGGDEFAIILPATTAEAAAEAIQRIHSVAELNNKFHGTPELRLSMGAATGLDGANLTEVLREADDRMYVEKRAHHAQYGDREG